MRRYELTEWQWGLIADLFPPNGRRGKQWADHRRVLNGVFWWLYTGAQWREVPERYGPWQTVYGRFRRWRIDGTIAAILRRLQVRLNERGRIDSGLWCVDATCVRASRSAAGPRRGEKGAGRAARPRPRP